MTSHALLVLALLVHMAPEHVAELLSQSSAAWHYVAYGIEAGLLWLIIGAGQSLPFQAVAAYGAMEGAQRAGCRLALPMDRAPNVGSGQTLCDVATGMPMGLASLLAAVIVIVVGDAGRRPVLAWRL